MRNFIILFASITGMTVSAQLHPVLIDKFHVPKASIAPFMEKMDTNRQLIKTLPGFIGDNVFQQTEANGDLVVVTVAEWESLDSIAKAKETVQSEYKKTGFDLPGFIAKLGITMERGIFERTERPR